VTTIIDISRRSIPAWPHGPGHGVCPVLGHATRIGDSCNVGSVTMSLHTGTHADALCTSFRTERRPREWTSHRSSGRRSFWT